MSKIQLECLVFRRKNNKIEFLLLKRTPEKGGFWQPPCGGMEDRDNSLLDAAHREIFEETGITKNKIIRIIDTVHYFEISKHYITGAPIPLIKEYAYGFEVAPDVAVDISKNECDEHSEFLWVDINKALDLLKWDDNKTSFKKLNEILSNTHQ